MSAARSFHQIKQCYRRRTGSRAHVVIFEPVKKTLVHLDVGPRVKHHAIAGQPITSGSTNLLIPRLNILRHVAMNHESHVRFVDAHAKRDRRDNHINVIPLKRFLIAGAFVGFKARVVRQRANTL